MFGLFGKSRKKGPEYPEVIIARLNARVKPIERGEYFEDPLDPACGSIASDFQHGQDVL